MGYSSALGTLSPDAQLVLVVVVGMIALLLSLTIVVVLLMTITSKDIMHNLCDMVRAFVPFFARKRKPKRKPPTKDVA